MAVTQIQEKTAPRKISVNGIDYILRKDALSSDPSFPFERMSWLYAGCDKVMGVYCCWIVGVIPPTPNSLERPVSVFALGFSGTRVMMAPNALSPTDMSCMHYYVADTDSLVQKFVNKFLGIEAATEDARTKITPYPEMNDGEDTKGTAKESRSVDGVD